MPTFLFVFKNPFEYCACDTIYKDILYIGVQTLTLVVEQRERKTNILNTIKYVLSLYIKIRTKTYT